MQFVYQDVLKPPDEYDQIMFVVKNTYDQIFFNLSLNLAEFDTYRGVETEAYEYLNEKTQWYIHMTISFAQPIKLTESLWKTLFQLLSSQKQFQILTNFELKSFSFTIRILEKELLLIVYYCPIKIDYQENEYVLFFAEIYPVKVTNNKLIRDACIKDADCADPNAKCIVSCDKPNCLTAAKVCRCNQGYYESINLATNNPICGKNCQHITKRHIYNFLT